MSDYATFAKYVRDRILTEKTPMAVFRGDGKVICKRVGPQLDNYMLVNSDQLIGVYDAQAPREWIEADIAEALA